MMQGRYSHSLASASNDDDEDEDDGSAVQQNPSEVSGRKRAKLDQGEGTTDVSEESAKGPSKLTKASRARVHYSCIECHRRKQKCNRQVPCSHCIARKIPERCRTFQPGEDPNDVMARVNRLEATMNDKFDRVLALLREHRPIDVTMTEAKQHDASAPSVSSLPTTRGDARQTGVVAWRKGTVGDGDALPGRSTRTVAGEEQAEGSEAGDEVVLYNGGPDTSSTSFSAGNLTTRVNTLISDVKDNRSNKMADPLLLTDPVRNVEQSAQLDALMFEVGATYSISQVLLAALPPTDLCRALVEHFFDHNWLRQPLSRRYYMERFDAFWREGPTLTPNNLNLYALYLLTASIGILTYRGPLQVSEDARVIRLTAKRLFFAARQGLLISTMLGREDVEQVVCFQLASRFLFIDRRVSEAWSCVASAVKTAHSIGLHRDGTMLGLPRHICAARRRIWAVTYFTERILCMNLGRPTAIDDDVVDVEMIDDEDVEGEFDEFSRPVAGKTVPNGEKPRFLTFTLIRQKLAKIMGQVIAIYQNVQMPAHYSDVVSVDNSLEALHKSFPDHLKSEFDSNGELHHFDQTWDEVYPFVPVHRYLLQAELLFVRMSLHRPYLIRPSRTSSGGGDGASTMSPSTTTTRENQRKSSNARSSTSTSTTSHHHHHIHHHRYNFSRRSCIEAAYQTLMLRKDLSDMIKSQMGEGDLPPSWVAQIGTYNTLSAIVILSIYLLTDPKAENAEMMIKPLKVFYDLYQVKRRRTTDDLREREFTILRMFLERIEEARSDANLRASPPTRQSTDVRAKSSGRKTGKQKGVSGASEKQSQISSLPFVESPLSSKEEDTAGALLDLNQAKRRSHDARDEAVHSALVDAKHSTSSSTRAEQNFVPAKDAALPWPYLPLRTPHHTGTSSSTNLSSSPQTTQTPPIVAASADGAKPAPSHLHQTIDGDESANGSASVHQLFDSWFRSNAFENVDIDALNMGAEGIPFLSEQTTSTDADTTFAIGSGGNLGAADVRDPINAGGTYFGFGMPSAMQEGRSPLPKAPSVTSSNPFSNGVQWSTVPAPSYASTTASANGALMGSTTVLGQSYQDPPTANVSSVLPLDQSSAHQAQMMSTNSGIPKADAYSYDPTFWQSLIDKLAK